MSLASLLGGLALANAGLGVVHGFAAPVGGMFDAPHGAICAALLPHVMEINWRAALARAPQSETPDAMKPWPACSPATPARRRRRHRLGPLPVPGIADSVPRFLRNSGTRRTRPGGKGGAGQQHQRQSPPAHQGGTDRGINCILAAPGRRTGAGPVTLPLNSRNPSNILALYPLGGYNGET